MTFDEQAACRTMWQEIRGGDLPGQKAVAHTLINRVADGRWGKTFFEVCLSEYHGVHQFSGWNRNDLNRVPASRLADDDPKLLELFAAFNAARSEPDFTTGSMWYYSKLLPEPPLWTDGATFCGVWGNQAFYKGVK